MCNFVRVTLTLDLHFALSYCYSQTYNNNNLLYVPTQGIFNIRLEIHHLSYLFIYDYLTNKDNSVGYHQILTKEIGK